MKWEDFQYQLKQNAGCWDFGIVYAIYLTESPKFHKNLMFQPCSKLFYAGEYKLPWLMEVLSLQDSLGLSYDYLA